MLGKVLAFGLHYFLQTPMYKRVLVYTWEYFPKHILTPGHTGFRMNN